MAKTVEITQGETSFLEVSVAGIKKPYRIPLSNSLRMGDVMALREAMRLPKKRRNEGFLAAFYEIVCRYVPKKYVDALSVDEFSQLVDAWNDASAEAGVGLGE